MECCCANWIGELARTHAGGLAAIVRREGVHGADVLDVVQDAFYTLLGRADADGLRDRPDEAARLLATIARNAARNARRRHHRSKIHEPLDGLVAETPGPEVAIETAQLAGCMRELGDLHRRVVTLRVLEELSGAEAAERLGVSPGYIAVLLHRAREELASCMAR